MKKRIAYITTHIALLQEATSNGHMGQDVYVYELALQLANNGWEVDVFTPLLSGDPTKIRTVNPGVRLIQMGGSAAQSLSIPTVTDMGILSLQIRSFASMQNLVYDLIHADETTSALLAIELKKKLKLPFIFTVHQFSHLPKLQEQNQENSELEVDVDHQIMKRADAVIVGCPQDKADLILQHHASSKKTFVVPSGFNPNQFFPIDKAEARRMLNFNTTEKILLQVGSLRLNSGVDNVIKSMALLEAGKQNLRLIVLGSVEDEKDLLNNKELGRLKQLAEDLGLSKQVSFDEGVEFKNLQTYYAAADLLVNTPPFEGLGSTVLEAMACGTLVIGSEVGAIKFAVVDGKTGFVIPPKAPGLLADRIGLVLKNDALLDQLSRNSVRHANSSFTWGNIAEQVIDLYEYVLFAKTEKDQVSKPAATKQLNQSIPLRNLYLKRNMQAKFSN